MNVNKAKVLIIIWISLGVILLAYVSYINPLQTLMTVLTICGCILILVPLILVSISYISKEKEKGDTS